MNGGANVSALATRAGRGLSFFVQRYWTVRWDLEAQETHTQETLPHSCVNLVVDRIATEPGITAVDDVASPLAMSKRTLQRLFRRYVGVGPK